ncbi:MAG: YlmH/Sll1252 family protein [Clostridiales bacterium]|nr:YlmH/Sll1252 family protein [Clostridiales bacterium]
MNRSELLNKLSRTPEERLLLGRTWDQIQAAGQRSVPQVTHFLSPDEQNAVGSLLRALGDPPHKFWGGYEEAQRKVCVFMPDWMEWEDFDETPIAVLRATWYAGDSLTHRDILGSLMGQGIKRETGGDLLVAPSSCDLLVLSEVAPWLLQNFTSAGRTKLSVSQVGLEQLHIPVQEVKRIHDTVATLRLDAVAAAGFSVSRAKMADYIRAGRVSVNWKETERTDLAVKAGDVISCRGLGRCRLAETGGLSKKGRVNIEVERFL